MKDIWCTFKAGSLKLRKETVGKNRFKNKIIQDSNLFTHDTYLPTTKQAASKWLMHMQSVCNVLIMSVTYFSLSVAALRFFYI